MENLVKLTDLYNILMNTQTGTICMDMVDFVDLIMYYKHLCTAMCVSSTVTVLFAKNLNIFMDYYISDPA